jgi:RHS repeat-associated protein
VAFYPLFLSFIQPVLYHKGWTGYRGSGHLYDEFGTAIGIWGEAVNSYRYTGQEYDGSTMNSYNLRAREYYPTLGRFMQNDPIGDRGGSLNWFLYVKNNPINWTDLTGKTCGSKGNDMAIPDEIQYVFNFTTACYYHDLCYGDCISKPPKRNCDVQFFLNMQSSCAQNSWLYGECLRWAATYFVAVDKYGLDAFIQARDECEKNCNNR